MLKRMWENWERLNPAPRSEEAWTEYAKSFTTQTERWLDEGHGNCHFRDRKLMKHLEERLHHFDKERYSLFCWAILSNHCHIVIKPFDGHGLEDIIGSMKGVAARHINLSIRQSGALWAEESYDRIIRDDEHLWRVVQYIGRNPRLAGLQNEAGWRRWICPEWIDAGWRFND